MSTITLEVPDELAARLTAMGERLPELLSLALDLSPKNMPLAVSTSGVNHPVFHEMIDFLAGGPTPQQIAAFKVSQSAQARLDELLDKNREAGATEAEAAELEVYRQVNHVMLLLKARARSALSN